MPVDEIIIRLFVMGDDRLVDVKQPADAQLYPSEVVTLGRLIARKGGKFRALSRWLQANDGSVCPKLHERIRRARVLLFDQPYTDRCLADLRFYTVIDTFGIELIHPRREGRSKQQIGQNGRANGRWIVGINSAWLITAQGQVVDWTWDAAAEPDNAFTETAQQDDGRTVSLADMGFRKKGAALKTIKICEQGRWNERFLIETLYRFVEGIVHGKKRYHRKDTDITARLGSIEALFNYLLHIMDGVLSFKDFVL